MSCSNLQSPWNPRASNPSNPCPLCRPKSIGTFGELVERVGLEEHVGQISDQHQAAPIPRTIDPSHHRIPDIESLKSPIADRSPLLKVIRLRRMAKAETQQSNRNLPCATWLLIETGVEC